MNTKSRIQDVAVVILVWLAALSLVLLVVFKLRFLMHHIH